MLEVRGLTKSYGALRASDGIDFDVRQGETHAVIGPNGAGKTTFISQLAGDLRPDAGRIVFAGEDVTELRAPRRARKGLARSFQITSVYHEFSALDNVALAVQAHAGHSFRFWHDARRDPSLRTPALGVLDDLAVIVVGVEDRALPIDEIAIGLDDLVADKIQSSLLRFVDNLLIREGSLRGRVPVDHAPPAIDQSLAIEP